MFDIGFGELVVVGIVALLVLGPERLPKVARTAGLWAGRARRVLSEVKADIDRELRAEELKRLVEEQNLRSGIHEMVEETRAVVKEIQQPSQPDQRASPVAHNEGAKQNAAIAAPAEGGDALPRDPNRTGASSNPASPEAVPAPRHDRP